MPPVTEAKSPPASRMTGADSPVIALSSTEATPSMTSPSSGIESPASTSTTAPFFSSSASCGCHGAAVLRRVQHLGDDLLLHAAQARGLRLAAAFGERLGEVGEQHREPQPDRDGEDERRRRLALAGQRLDAEHRRQDAADVDDEHHRVAPLHARVELGEGVDDRRPHERRVEERERDAGRGHGAHFARKQREVLGDRPERQRRHVVQQADQHDGADQQQRRTAGRASAACRASPASRFLAASEPASASTGTMTAKRPNHIATASIAL